MPVTQNSIPGANTHKNVIRPNITKERILYTKDRSQVSDYLERDSHIKKGSGCEEVGVANQKTIELLTMRSEVVSGVSCLRKFVGRVKCIVLIS